MLHRVQVTDISTSTVQRRLRESGLHGRIAAKKARLKETNKKKLAWAKKHEQWTLDRWKCVLWSDESKFEIFGSNRCVFVRGRPGERRVSAYVWFPPWSMEEEAWWCGGALLVTLSAINLELKTHINQHGFNSILQRCAIPSGLRLVGSWFVFQQDNDPKHTSKVDGSPQ